MFSEETISSATSARAALFKECGSNNVFFTSSSTGFPVLLLYFLLFRSLHDKCTWVYSTRNYREIIGFILHQFWDLFFKDVSTLFSKIVKVQTLLKSLKILFWIIVTRSTITSKTSEQNSHRNLVGLILKQSKISTLPTLSSFPPHIMQQRYFYCRKL